jgi:predicted AAA+ superfamily ATPase
MFRRKVYDKLLEWKATSNGKTALLIEGARRVGKTTIVEEFAKNEYQSHILIDFAFATTGVKELFHDISDLDYLFLQLQLQFKADLHERRSLIIFDEVQLCPQARQAIKNLVQDGRYDYIETGSLISIKKNVQNILIPSEERKIEMFPMDFEEFLWATGDHTTNELLRKIFSEKISLGQRQNRELMRKFRLYMLVGGMPQAVNAYLETNNFKYVDEVKRDILNLYEADFYKIDPSGKISMLFAAIPSELSRDSSRYQVSSVLKNHRASAISNEISELVSSKTVLISYHVNDPAIGMTTSLNTGQFRLFMADTGLMVTLMFKDKDFTDNIIYEKLLSDTLPKNLGLFYENIVAQTLTCNGIKLFYNTYYDEIQKRIFEVDFLLAEGHKVSPLEVKSSKYRVHRSIDEFSKKHSDRINSKYVVHTKDLKKSGDLLYLPFYLVQFIR